MKIIGRKIQFLALLLCLLGAGFWQSISVASAAENMEDPLEPMNRAIFSFNLAVQKAVIRPLAKGYDSVTPVYMQDRASDFLNFLKSPVIFLNNVLQGDVEGAKNTTVRFMVNGSIGLFGFIDVMEPQIPYRGEDFGQTLAVWGVESGPYLVLPLFGPSSVRDTGGLAVDMMADPMPKFVENQDLIREREYSIAKGMMNAITWEADNYTRIERLEEESLDFYSTVRSLYQQKRASDIINGDINKNENPYMEMAFE